ncbi:hypothetical protein JHK86_049887 [Glycine max]|nr:hypothetical protein JHK86_049887 [Glycine max]
MSKSQQLQSLIDGISHLFCRSDWITKLTHVYRESNRCADLLANHGHDQESLLVLFDLGMASVMQTVCGKTYGKKYSTMNIILQKAIIIHLGAIMILTCFYWFPGSFLKAIVQSESIAE